MGKTLIGSVEAAKFSKKQLEKANNASSVVFTAEHIYVGWAQQVAKQSGAPDDTAKKFLLIWDIVPSDNRKTLMMMSRSKFGGLYVEDTEILRDEVSGKYYVPGYKEDTIYNESGKKIRFTVPVQDVFRNDCSPIFKGTEDGKNPEQDGPMFVIEPFAFKCLGKEVHYTTMPVRINGNYTIAHFRDMSEDETSDAVRILMLKKNMYVFDNPEESIKELVEKYDLFIPKEASHLSLVSNPDWFQ